MRQETQGPQEEQEVGDFFRGKLLMKYPCVRLMRYECIAVGQEVDLCGQIFACPSSSVANPVVVCVQLPICWVKTAFLDNNMRVS